MSNKRRLGVQRRAALERKAERAAQAELERGQRLLEMIQYHRLRRILEDDNDHPWPDDDMDDLRALDPATFDELCELAPKVTVEGRRLRLPTNMGWAD